MKTPLDRARPLEVTAKWRNGVRTPGWDRLWRRIISAVMEEARAADQNMANAESIRGQSLSGVDDEY